MGLLFEEVSELVEFYVGDTCVAGLRSVTSQRSTQKTIVSEAWKRCENVRQSSQTLCLICDAKRRRIKPVRRRRYVETSLEVTVFECQWTEPSVPRKSFAIRTKF